MRISESMPEKGDVFEGKINDLSQYNVEGFRCRDIWFFKSELPRLQGGASWKGVEGDCIPLTPAPHSSPSTGRGILRERFHKYFSISNDFIKNQKRTSP